MKKSLVKIALFSVAVAVATIGNAEQSSLAQSSVVSASTAQSAIHTASVSSKQEGDKTVLISPRTGMRYILNNPSRVAIVFKTEALAPVNAQNINRIVATNPAISPQSQEQAKQELRKLANITPAL